jgi:tetratricopeptide (TPR) repeat protein
LEPRLLALYAQNRREKMSIEHREIVTENERKWLEKELVKIGHQLKTEKFNVELYLKKATAEIVLGLRPQAIESAKTALSLDETCFMAWFQLGMAYLEENQFLHAKETFTRALDCWEKHPDKKEHSVFAKSIMKYLQDIEMYVKATKRTEKKGA